jgi:5-formyltetrahydrofolate cyclo-ligase
MFVALPDFFYFSAPTMLDDPRALRQRLRAQRRDLPPAARQQAALAVAARLAEWPVFLAARRIAGYWACDGELNPCPLLERAWSAGQQVFLPILRDDASQPLQFAPYWRDTPLRCNRFRIPEPDTSPADWLEPAALDVVLTPLVAFDPVGARLGMGGGFYDRSFAFRRDPATGHEQHPWLVGLGYAFQQVAALPRQPWDVPLDGVVTEAALTLFRQAAA